MAILNLTYEYFDTPDNDMRFDSEVCSILRRFLQPSRTKSVQQTVKSIIKLLPDDASASNELMSINPVILNLADQIPYHHPSHIKLARVVEEICRWDKFIKANNKVRTFPYPCLLWGGDKAYLSMGY